MKYVDIGNGRFYNEDLFDALSELPDHCVDMVLCDLPYGTTAIAAQKTGRRWVCIEKEEKYFNAAVERIRNDIP